MFSVSEGWGLGLGSHRDVCPPGGGGWGSKQAENEVGVPGECLQLVVGLSQVMSPVVKEGGEPGRAQEGPAASGLPPGLYFQRELGCYRCARAMLSTSHLPLAFSAVDF